MAEPRPNRHLTAEEWDAVRELVEAAQFTIDACVREALLSVIDDHDT